ncbi:uncharacterized protein LOC144103316 [Amblyomma americanum]
MQCESHHKKAEQLILKMEQQMYRYLQESLFFIKEEARHRLNVVDETLKNMSEQFLKELSDNRVDKELDNMNKQFFSALSEMQERIAESKFAMLEWVRDLRQISSQWNHRPTCIVCIPEPESFKSALLHHLW